MEILSDFLKFHIKMAKKLWVYFGTHTPARTSIIGYLPYHPHSEMRNLPISKWTRTSDG